MAGLWLSDRVLTVLITEILYFLKIIKCQKCIMSIYISRKMSLLKKDISVTLLKLRNSKVFSNFLIIPLL